MKYTIKKEYWAWTEEFNDISDLLEEVSTIEELNLKESYNELLNECYGMVTLGGYEYEHAIAWERTDEIAYHQGFLSFVDSAIWQDLEEQVERMTDGEELQFYSTTITAKEEEEQGGESK